MNHSILGLQRGGPPQPLLPRHLSLSPFLRFLVQDVGIVRLLGLEVLVLGDLAQLDQLPLFFIPFGEPRVHGLEALSSHVAVHVILLFLGRFPPSLPVVGLGLLLLQLAGAAPGGAVDFVLLAVLFLSLFDDFH